MKNLSFFVSAFALCASTSYAAINCGTLPSCASLGYSDAVSQCPKSSAGAELVVKCPFDTTQGKCIREAAVGQIAYFSKAPNSASGWLKCDGTTFTKTKYPELYALIGQQFCNTYNGGTCGTDVGRLPKYTGMFLRVYGSPANVCGASNDTTGTSACTANSSLGVAAPQVEGLPNITGKGGYYESHSSMKGDSNNATTQANQTRVSGAFYLTDGTAYRGAGSTDDDSPMLNFDDSKSNAVYGRQNGVIPANYAVYAYIYAGKKAQ